MCDVFFRFMIKLTDWVRLQGHDMPIVGLPFKKKRGRKPKNYHPHLEQQLAGNSKLIGFFSPSPLA